MAELPKQGYQNVLLIIDSTIVPTMNTVKGMQYFREVKSREATNAEGKYILLCPKNLAVVEHVDIQLMTTLPVQLMTLLAEKNTE